MDCELLTVGTELLLGFTVDTNAADAGRRLAAAGIRLVAHHTVGDEHGAVQAAVAAALERTGTVIVTGGLGPTKDDLTREAVAGVFGRRLVRDPALVAALEERFRRLGRGPMPEANRQQADVPEGATVLPNRAGSAPGLWIEDERGRLAVLLPGVPVEMRGLLEQEVIPRLTARAAGTGAAGHGGAEAAGTGAGGPGGTGSPAAVILSRTLRTTGVSESALADKVGDPGRLLGEHVTLAWLPGPEGTDLRLTAWGLAPAEAEAALAKSAAALRPLLGAACYGEGEADLAALVLAELERRQAKLAVAESCTGGLLGARITGVPGSSRVFLGGVVAYDNEVKGGLLGVSADDLVRHGAVSEEVVRQMCAGAARALAADAAIAVTGIAGPDGGTPAKPVGTVWIGVQWQGRVRAFQFLLPGDRETIRRRAAQAGLDAMRRALSEAGGTGGA